MDHHLTQQPEASRKAAQEIQDMDPETRTLFIHALENATCVEDLPEPFRSLMQTDTVTIRNPNSGIEESLSQATFNQYISMTNGEFLKWIIEKDS